MLMKEIGNKETRQPSGSGLTYETREGGRRMSRPGSGMKSPDRGDIAFRSVSREANRTFWLNIHFVLALFCVGSGLNETMLMIYNR
jgi:hypothetical protein